MTLRRQHEEQGEGSLVKKFIEMKNNWISKSIGEDVEEIMCGGWREEYICILKNSRI